MDSRPDAAEEVHQIHGTGISFSSKPDSLDGKATKALCEIEEKGIHGMEVHDDAFGMDPQQLPKGFFLSEVNSFLNKVCNNLEDKKDAMWRLHGSSFGYGIGHHASSYRSFRISYAYHKGNHKTNWIINVYLLIQENSYVKWGEVVLCHVFQSDNYDPRPISFPRSVVPNISDFHEKQMNSRMQLLEGLMNNPESFKDFYDLDEMYSKCQAKGRNGKRADIWKHFTPIKVLGPDGEVMFTLAICHYCNMAYLTGKRDSKTGSLSNNGTKTLKEHYRKCSDQHHIAGNPQGAHH